jgi:hypothetical protein
MQGTDRDDSSLDRPLGRKATSRVLFWLEMLVVAAGIAGTAVLVGSDYSVVRSRQEILAQYKQNPEFICIARDDPAFPVSERTANVSWLRRILGDNAIRMILLPRGTTNDAELAHVRSIFPEANVQLLPIETKRVNDRSGRSSPSSRLSG